MENRVDETTIRSVIRPVLLWQLRTNELVRYHGERALFFAKSGRFFFNSASNRSNKLA